VNDGYRSRLGLFVTSNVTYSCWRSAGRGTRHGYGNPERVRVGASSLKVSTSFGPRGPPIYGTKPAKTHGSRVISENERRNLAAVQESGPDPAGTPN